MKIAFYTTTILEYGGGFEKYLIETAGHLTEHYNVQIDIITMDDYFTKKILYFLKFYYFKKFNHSIIYKERRRNIKIKLSKARYYKCTTIEKLKTKLNEYDVIYSKNEILESFIFKHIIGYKKIPPVIFGCHTPIYYPITKSIQSKLHNFLYNSFVYRYLTSGVKCFHVINSFDEQHLKKLFPKKDVVKIYNPFDFDAFVKKADTYKYDFNWDKSKFNILWVGSLTESKGIGDLTKIIDDINQTEHRTKIIWNVFGDGELRNKVIDTVRKWNNVNYFGYVESNYLASIYRKNDLFISTSQWEGFPYNLLEAQSFGLPVTAYNIKGCNDIIETNYNGFLVENIEEFKNKTLSFVCGKVLDLDIAQFMKSKFNKDKFYRNLTSMFNEYGKKYHSTYNRPLR